MVAMNRFIGKRIFLPTTVLCLACVPLMFFEIPEHMTLGFTIVIIVAVVAVLILSFSALPKILGNHFEKNRRGDY